VPSVGPPFTCRFTRQGRHGIHEYDQVDGLAITDQRCREPGERLDDRDEFLPVSGGSKDGLDGVMGTSRVVSAGQVHRDGELARLLELWHHPMPHPRP
jgi:hypothetical protein